MMGLGLMLAVAGVFVLIAGAARAAMNRNFANGVEAVKGSVESKQKRTVRNGRSYELTVSYTVNGIPYEKVVGALLTEYETIALGDEIELLYKTANPKKAIRPMALRPRNVGIALIFGAVLTVAGAALFLIGRI